MSVHTTPAPARSDAATRAGVAPSATGPTRREPRGIGVRAVRLAGAALAAGSLSWAVSFFAFGADPAPRWELASALTTLPFQLALLGLIAVQYRTGAIGTGRLARAFYVVEHVLVFGAMGNTVFGNDGSALGLAMDLCWPLSMLGMLAIGVRIAVTRRWSGLARVWPLVAESWAVVVIPAYGAVPSAAQYVAGAHILVGYVGLGLVLLARPHLTGARD